jgi:hypothetical protein
MNKRIKEKKNFQIKYYLTLITFNSGRMDDFLKSMKLLLCYIIQGSFDEILAHLEHFSPFILKVGNKIRCEISHSNYKKNSEKRRVNFVLKNKPFRR